MTNIIRDDAAQWRQLCQNAFREPEPATLLQRVVEARSAVLHRIEDIHSKPITGEQYELRNALKSLIILQEHAERDIWCQSRHLESISQRAHRVHRG
jgi:hypothetical protein